MAFNTREENAADLAHEEVAKRDFERSIYEQCDEEDDREERTRAGTALQGVCKDCGNGTLNNSLNPAFEVVERDYADGEAELVCNACGSSHLDIL